MVTLEHPSNRELEEEEINKMIAERFTACDLKKYIGEKFNNGFVIEKDTALTIIRTYAPEKELETTVDYTITTIGNTTMLIGRNSSGIVECTVEMPKEVEPILAAPKFEEALKEYKAENALYSRIRWLGYGAISFILIILTAVVYLVYKIV